MVQINVPEKLVLGYKGGTYKGGVPEYTLIARTLHLGGLLDLLFTI